MQQMMMLSCNWLALERFAMVSTETSTWNDIKFHADTGREHVAVNVKVPYWPPIELLTKYYELFRRIGYTIEEFSMMANDEVDLIRENFWLKASQNIAVECGFTESKAEGRSDGWIAPFPYVYREDLTDRTIRENVLSYASHIKLAIEDGKLELPRKLNQMWELSEKAFLIEHSVAVRSMKAWSAV